MIFNCIDDFYTIPYSRPHPFAFEELDNQTVGFIEYVLDKHPEIIGNNTRSFIPAHIRRIGHNNVRDLVFKINKNAVVIVINGVEKTIQYIDIQGHTKTLPISSEGEEVCETISRLLIKHSLESRPIVITGHLCVGMGQTLVHQSIGSFTSAIFGHLDLTNDEIYQLFGRITGRMKDWDDKYVQTQVYCPTIIMNRCIVMEECARNMANDHNGALVTQNNYREPMVTMGEIGKSAIENIRHPKKKKNKVKSKDEDKLIRVFKSEDDAIKFGNSIGGNFRKRKTDKAPETLLQNNGKNPTTDYILKKRFYGISSNKPKPRMCPISDPEGTWCVYWRPSCIN
jgi:hypothetical protein